MLANQISFASARLLYILSGSRHQMYKNIISDGYQSVTVTCYCGHVPVAKNKSIFNKQWVLLLLLLLLCHICHRRSQWLTRHLCSFCRIPSCTAVKISTDLTREPWLVAPGCYLVRSACLPKSLHI